MWYVHEHEHDYSKSSSVLTVNRPGAPIWECEKTIKLYNSQLKIYYCYCIMQQFFERVNYSQCLRCMILYKKL